MADGGSARGPGAYALGVDLGTTYTAAALYRGGQVTMVELATRSSVAPSVVLVRPDGTSLYGEAADRRALLEPAHVAREFKRRMGDAVPMLLGGVAHSPESLGARLLAWVVERVSEAEGAAPAVVAVTHPANWGPYKQEVFGQLLELAGQPGALRVSEPEAAAIAYAADERPPPDAHLAVYDLGGGTFDTVVLRRRDDRFAIVGQPAGIEHLGGVDFDEALYRWVWERATGPSVGFDLDDEVVRRDLAGLRRECVAAKEALSVDTDVVVAVRVGPVQRDIIVSRDQFADLIRSTLSATTVALGRVVDGAGLTPDQLHGVLLVGGSSRIPLVTELIEAELDRPVVLDVHPKHVVARGAALLAGASLPAAAGPARRGAAPRLPSHEPAMPAAEVPAPQPDRPRVVGPAEAEAAAAGNGDSGEDTGRPPLHVPEPFVPPAQPSVRLRPVLLVVGVIVAGMAVGAWLARGRGDDGGGASTGTTASTTVAPPTTAPADPDRTGVQAWNDWTNFVLASFDQISDEIQKPEPVGDAACAVALNSASIQFGDIGDRAGLHLPARLADDIERITRPDRRQAMLQSIDARIRVLQLCSVGNYTGALDANERLRELDVAVAATNR